ncbi:MAG TPA: hypothetical protein EYO73_04800 [Sulfurimonas sp.]|nr:hypothetical protein [Sulfurimonas sp.]
MDTSIEIKFKVTPKQKAIIESRVFENGFDDISAYVKVVALKSQEFRLTTAGEEEKEATIELGFRVTQGQVEKLEENMEKSKCEDLETYLRFVALHAVVYTVVEVRSTGNFDAMLERIAEGRRKPTRNAFSAYNIKS